MIRVSLIIIALIAVLATGASAQMGVTFFPGPGMIASGGGGGGCTGTINLSTGCAQPMLGGL